MNLMIQYSESVNVDDHIPTRKTTTKNQTVRNPLAFQ